MSEPTEPTTAPEPASDAEPEPTQSGNPEWGDDKRSQMLALFDEPDEPADPAPDGSEGSDDDPPAPDEAKAKPDDKPPETPPEPDEKPNDLLWAARQEKRRLKAERQALKAEQEAIARQRAEIDSAAPVLEVQRLIREGRRTEAIARLAGMTGTTAEKLYLELTEEQLKDPDAPENKGKPALTEEQIDAIVAKRMEEREHKLRTETRGRTLQTAFHELTFIGKDEGLAKRFPYLGSMTSSKLAVEMENAVLAAERDEQLRPFLDNRTEFASRLNEVAQQEFHHQLERALELDPEGVGRILSAKGYGLSSKPDGNGKPSTGSSLKPDGPQTPPSSAASDRPTRARTITNADTQTDGALRQLDPDEKRAAIEALFRD